jgi:hypothetical protein
MINHLTQLIGKKGSVLEKVMSSTYKVNLQPHCFAKSEISENISE